MHPCAQTQTQNIDCSSSVVDPVVDNVSILDFEYNGKDINQARFVRVMKPLRILKMLRLLKIVKFIS